MAATLTLILGMGAARFTTLMPTVHEEVKKWAGEQKQIGYCPQDVRLVLAPQKKQRDADDQAGCDPPATAWQRESRMGV